MRELDDRETEIEERWARLEADAELREIKLEQREKMVGELELRLGKRESDLAQYVGQLQTQMDDRESDWWSKQLGTAVVANGANGDATATGATARRFATEATRERSDPSGVFALGHRLCRCPSCKQNRRGARPIRADPSTERSFLGQTAQPPRRPLRLEGERSRVR